MTELSKRQGIPQEGKHTRHSRIVMKRGKINLLNFDDGDEEEEEAVNFSIHQRQKHQQTQKQPQKSNTVHFDLSQIKDRVIQMELNEEIILDGEAVEALLNESTEVGSESFDDAEMVERIREAKQKRSLFAGKDYEDDEGATDFIPVTTKSEYWLSRDTRESEESFQSTTNSRFVREDFFNEKEVDDPTNSFTNFIGTGTLGRQGLMMTSKMLERDLKTDLYDLEIKEEDGSDPLNGEDYNNWERGQILKGIEKGWNATETEASFYAKQAKLKHFVPPPKFTTNSFAIDADIDTAKLEENIGKISQDSGQLEARIDTLKLEIIKEKSLLKELNDLESFFLAFSQFLKEKFTELREIEEAKDLERWEHFFDNAPEDFLNLPEIIEKANKLNLNSPKYLSESTGIFVKYHFLWDSRDPKEIWEASALKDAFAIVDPQLLKEMFREIFASETDKFERIKIIFE